MSGPEHERSQNNGSFDSREFRNALGRFASGVTVITAQDTERVHGMTANAFVSVSLDPPLVLVSLDNRSNMHRILPTVDRCGISVLAENQQAFSDYFAGRTVHGLEVRFLTRLAVPLLEGAVAHFVVQPVDIHQAGDHTLYICRVEHFEYRDAQPLLFYGGRYRHVGAERLKPTPWPQDELSLFSIGSIDPPVDETD